MKKIRSIFMIAVLVFSLAACAKTQQKNETSSETKTKTDKKQTTQSKDETNKKTTTNGKTLIAYFSWSSEGNTEKMATYIQKQTGGDLLKLEPAKAYPTDYNETGEIAKKERDKDARPKIKDLPKSISEYDTIFVGYPIWNSDLPMPLYTFFEEYDFSGKTIILFVTHGGSGFSDTIETIKELEPKADVVESGLSISRDDVADAQDEVKEWSNALLKD